jgi:hypothetical protein
MSLPSNPTDNATTAAPQSTAGFKISKPGYDANTSSGSNLVFDSSWPSLPIVFEKTITNTITNPISFTTIAVPHNQQKIVPFAMCWLYGPDPNGGTVGTAPYGVRFIPAVDRTNIYINPDLIGVDIFNATKIRVMAFNLDMATDIDPGDTFELPYDNSYGIKVVKPSKDINSTDMRDFVLHSRCQSPLIQAVKTQATTDSANPTTVSYTNKNASPCWVYGFIESGQSYAAGVPSGAYIPAPYYNQAYPKTFTDGFKSYLDYDSPDTGASLIILRDPMYAPNKTTVYY